jgi:zinc D-Ala-D-Ala carboxypeptidase
VKLSENFTLEEMTRTDAPFSNSPNGQSTEKLIYLASYLLQPLRNRFGRIHVTSGFRSREVNKHIGGAFNSQHLLGEAADIVPEDADIDTVFNWARQFLIYGQIILENKNGSRWIHISLPRIFGQNMMAMTYNDGKYANV